MLFFKKNKIENNDKNKQNELEKVQSERDDIKNELNLIYKDLGFSSKDINELFKIIDSAHDKIENLKKQLIGSNINNNPKEIQARIVKEINQLSTLMQVDLKAKTHEIMKKNKLK